MSDGVFAVLVDPRLQGHVVVSDLFPVFLHLRVEMYGIGSTPLKSFPRF